MRRMLRPALSVVTRVSRHRTEELRLPAAQELRGWGSGSTHLSLPVRRSHSLQNNSSVLRDSERGTESCPGPRHKGSWWAMVLANFHQRHRSDSEFGTEI